MNLKPIIFDIELLSTKSQTSTATIMTNDYQSAELVFNIEDHEKVDLPNATVDVLLYMRDGSFFQNEDAGDIKENSIRYVLKPNEGKHAGMAKVQLIVKSGGVRYATGFYEFDIQTGLNDRHTITEIVITNWDQLVREAQAYIAQFVEGEADRRELFETNELNRQIAFKSNENNRQKNEVNRAEQEITRVTAENTRELNEQERVSAESVRVANEEERELSEAERISKDSERDSKIDSKADKSYVDNQDAALTAQLADKVNKVQEGWITPTLQNGWVSPVGSELQYYKDSFNVVHLRGTSRSGTIATTVFQFPTGYRPAKDMQFSAPITLTTIGRVSVLASGVVWIRTTGDNTFDGITFRAEA